MIRVLSDNAYHLRQARTQLRDAAEHLSVPIFALKADFAEEQNRPGVQGSAVSPTEERLTRAEQALTKVNEAIKLVDGLLL